MMVEVVVSYPGETVVKEFQALVERTTVPPGAPPPSIGLVEISAPEPTDTGSDILSKLLLVDGPGSGLDADLLDGQHGAYYLDRNNHVGPINPASFDDTTHGNRGGGALHALATGAANGFMSAPDKGKLDGIEPGATQDQTPAEILAAVMTVDGAGSGLDADLLDGQHGSYYLAFGNLTGGLSDVQHGNRGGGSLHALATPSVAGFMTDAPSDGTTYARLNGAWAATSTFVDAPADSKAYGRRNNAWYEVLPAASYTAADVLAKLLTVDGAGSNLDADLLDGQSSAYYLARANHTGTQAWSTLTGTPTTIAGYGITDAYTKTAVDNADNLRVLKAGDTMTGNLTIQTTAAFLNIRGTAGYAELILDKSASGQISYIEARTNALARWQIQMSNSTAEGGANAGSDFFIYRFSDAGAALDAPLQITRSTGKVTANGAFLANGQIDSGSNVIAVGTVQAGSGIFQSPGGASPAILCNTSASPAAVYLRPNGFANGTDAFISTTANLTIAGPSGVKSTGTTWANPSDARIKNLVGDYPVGLDAILALRPRVFTYKGNDTRSRPGTDPAFPDAPASEEVQTVPYRDSPHYQMAIDGKEFVGFIAQEVEVVMPEMATLEPLWIDGEPVADFRVLDTNNLALAMVNAIKTLHERVAALEAA